MQLLWLSKNASSGNKCTQNTQVLLSLIISLGEQDLLKHEATCVVDSIYFHVFYHKISKLKSNHLNVFDNETLTRPRWEALHPAVPKIFLCAAACRRVKVRLKSQHSPREKHYDTRAHTNMVHTREAKHAETFLWIDLDGRNILLRSSQWVWQNRDKKHYVPRGYNLPATTNAEANTGHTALTRKREYPTWKTCWIISMLLYRNNSLVEYKNEITCYRY